MADPPPDDPVPPPRPPPGYGPPPGYWEPARFQAPGGDQEQPGYGPPPWCGPPAGYWEPSNFRQPPGYRQATGPGAYPYPPPLPKGGTEKTGPLPLHPMSLSDILDSSFRLLRSNFRTISTIVAVLVVPIQLASALASRSLFSGHSAFTTFNDTANGVQTQTNTSPTAVSSISSLASLLILPFAAGAISKVVAGSYMGIDVSAGAALRAAGRRFFPLLFAWLLVHLLEGLGGVLLVLPGLLVMALSVSVAPAIVTEQLGPLKGIRRSWRLNRRRMWGILGIALLSGLVFSVVTSFIALPLEIAGLAIGLHWGWILLFIAGVLSSLISLPLNASVATLVYFDGRIRNEGFDLQTLAARLNS